MAKLNATYKCSVCGNVVKVLEEGTGTLVCCGQDMDIIAEPQDNKEK